MLRPWGRTDPGVLEGQQGARVAGAEGVKGREEDGGGEGTGQVLQGLVAAGRTWASTLRAMGGGGRNLTQVFRVPSSGCCWEDGLWGTWGVGTRVEAASLPLGGKVRGLSYGGPAPGSPPAPRPCPLSLQRPTALEWRTGRVGLPAPPSGQPIPGHCLGPAAFPTCFLTCKMGSEPPKTGQEDRELVTVTGPGTRGPPE